MNIHIICPDASETFEIVWVECETLQGNFVIQAGHSPTVLTLLDEKPCIMGLSDGTRRVIYPTQAVIHIMPNLVTLFVQQYK